MGANSSLSGLEKRSLLVELYDLAWLSVARYVRSVMLNTASEPVSFF